MKILLKLLKILVSKDAEAQRRSRPILTSSGTIDAGVLFTVLRKGK